MNVVVCFKSVYDDVAIRTNSDKTLDYQAVPHIVSLYDLNAIEAAAQFVEGSNGEHSLIALTVGDTKIHDTTMRKNVAARGASEVYLVMDDDSKMLKPLKQRKRSRQPSSISATRSYYLR